MLCRECMICLKEMPCYVMVKTTDSGPNGWIVLKLQLYRLAAT